MRPRWWPGSLLRTLLALLLLVAAGGPAWGHAVLLEQSPGDGAALEEAPEVVTLRFSESVEPVFLRVLDPEGRDVPAAGEVRAVGTQAILPLDAPLEDSSYLVTWRVISADGHSIGGSYRFAVGVALDEAAAPAISGDGAAWTTAAVIVRAAFYGSLLVAAGFPLLLLASPLPAGAYERAARMARGSAILGLGLVGAYLAATSLEVAGGDPAVLLQPERLATVLPPSLVTGVALAGLGLLGVLAAARARPVKGSWLLLAGPLLVAASFASSGHVATVEPDWLARSAVGVHALVAAFWVGSFYPLWCAVRYGPPEAASKVLEAFSKVALPAVAALLAAGIVLTVLLLRAPADLVTTRYGMILAFKVLLVTALLAIAAVNRYRLVPRIRARSAREALRGLRRTLTADLGIAAAIVAATAALSTTAPPHALVGHAEHAAHAPTQRAGLSIYLRTDAHAALLVLRPARAGANRAELRLLGDEGEAREAVEAEIHLASPERGIAPVRYTAEPGANNVFQFEDLDVPFPGRWDLRADILIDEFTKVIFRTELEVER